MSWQRNQRKFDDSVYIGTDFDDGTARHTGQENVPKSSNPFAGLSIRDRTFLQKCLDTFFVFAGNSEKQGLLNIFLKIAALIIGGSVLLALLLALSPLILSLGPLAFFLFEKFQDDNTERSELTWWAAALWGIPGVIVAFGAVVGLAVALVALGVGLVAGLVGILIPVAAVALPAAPLIVMVMNQQDGQSYSWPSWIFASILAIPTIAAGLGLIVALAAAAIAIIVAVIVAVIALVIAYGAVAAALTIACMPIIAVVHAIWGPSHPLGITAVRRSFWLNPLTYVMAALLAVGISLLIQGVNPSVFLSAAAPLMIAQTVLMSMAVLAVLGGMLYAGYRVGLAIFPSKGKLILETVEQPALQVSIKTEPDQNYITKYLSEHWAWMKANWGKAGFFYGLMFVGVGGVTLLVANHFTAGLLFGAGTENLMKVVFDFMVSGFTSGLQSMAGLPGLEFLAASDATLMIIGQVFTVFTLIAAAIVIPYTGARLCQTVQEEIPSYPDAEYGYQTVGGPEELDPYGGGLFNSQSTPNPEGVKGLYQVKGKFEFAGQKGGLSFQEDEVLTVLTKPDSDGWVEARNEAGKTGSIPLTHVEKIVGGLQAKSGR